ncbi:MAG: hypothetical protein AAFO84_06710 [Cyanobacteria bacterium J06598_1]
MRYDAQPSLWQKISKALGSRVFHSWVFACIASYFLAYQLAPVPAIVVQSLPVEMTPARLAGVSLLSAVIIGLVFGLCQWFVLRIHFRKAYWWIVATALGYGMASLLGEGLLKFVFSVLSDPSVWGIAPLFSSESAAYTGQALMYGAVVGIAQWLFFRARHVHKSAAWIPVIVLTMLLIQRVPSPNFSVFMQQLDGSLPGLYMLFQMASIVVSGIVFGLSTGLLLLDFISQKEEQV